MKQKLLIAGAVLFLALFLMAGIMLSLQRKETKQSEDAFKSVAGLVMEKPEPPLQQDTTVSEISESIEDTEPQITAAQKYGAVYEQNLDFVGWLTIDGTNISYPVMQTPESPNYYLRRGFDKQYSRHGVPYVQENCSLDTSDNVVVYGHHMSDGTMFAELTKFESEDFYREHRTFSFDTMAGYGEYEIIAVFKTVAYSQQGFQYQKFVSAENEAEFNEFVSRCKSLALYDTGVTAEYGDKLISLSTCEYSRTNGRLIVVAKKVASNA